MKRKEAFVLDVQAATKSARMAIRLKHSLAADAEINEKVPALVDAMNDAAVNGQPYKALLPALLSELS